MPVESLVWSLREARPAEAMAMRTALSLDSDSQQPPLGVGMSQRLPYGPSMAFVVESWDLWLGLMPNELVLSRCVNSFAETRPEE